jgi:hypothetical protein
LVTYANRFFDKQAYGRLCKTTFICKYLLQLKLRHRINTQLHKGEQLHNLRAYLWFGGDGVIRKKQEHQQQITAQALNVLSNIVMVWNTVKRETAIFRPITIRTSMRIRLVGIRFTGLVRGSYQLDMFQATTEVVALYQAIDKIKHKFGSAAVKRGSALLPKENDR